MAGERLALEMVRHHRLIETYLQRALGFGLEALDDEADRLEHAISEKLEEKIDEVLGRPTFDPHGSPIPDRDGRISERNLVPLASLRSGESAVVSQLICRDPNQLRQLESIGLVPGAAVRVKVADSGSGIIRLELASSFDEPVGERIANCVLVSKTQIGPKKG